MKTSKPNDFGTKMLVENCQQVRIETLLKTCRKEFKKMILQSEIEAMGMPIELTTSRTHYNGIRFWFECPLCHTRVGVIYQHPLSRKIGCRKCLGLDYRKRRYKGMIEAKLL